MYIHPLGVYGKKIYSGLNQFPVLLPNLLTVMMHFSRNFAMQGHLMKLQYCILIHLSESSMLVYLH